MAEQTPGTWGVGGIDRATQGEVIQVPGLWIASVHDLPRHDQEGERKANAQLIAAAPDLLAACEAAEHALRSYQYGNSATDLAREIADQVAAAIAKTRAT